MHGRQRCGHPLSLRQEAVVLPGFQDATWIEVTPQGPCPEGVPQTCTAVPGGIQGFAFHRE